MPTKNILPTVPLVQVTGIDINVACVTIFVVCVFYTTAGGFKAVKILFQLSSEGENKKGR